MGTLTVLPGGGNPPAQPPVYDDVVRMLERVLTLAKMGEIDGIALAWTQPIGGACSCYSSEDGGVRLLGAVTLVQARMVQEMRS